MVENEFESKMTIISIRHSMVEKSSFDYSDFKLDHIWPCFISIIQKISFDNYRLGLTFLYSLHNFILVKMLDGGNQDICF